MIVPFVKMHGCGNDFVIIDERSNAWGLSTAQVARIADRHLGVGCDQLILLRPSAAADAYMHILNADGTEAGACGNATRCVADILMRERGDTALSIQTVAGILPARRCSAAEIVVDMGPPKFDWTDIPLAAPADTTHLDLSCGPLATPAACSMGNPHATFFVDQLNAVPITEVGPKLEIDPLFPQRANIGFAQILGPGHIRLRVWERGAGLTLACGSGACATLVNAHRRGLTHRKAQIDVDGGTLTIEWRDDNHVLMTGPAETAFSGQIDLAAIGA
jgi:diaminopimelate epimerase